MGLEFGKEFGKGLSLWKQVVESPASVPGRMNRELRFEKENGLDNDEELTFLERLKRKRSQMALTAKNMKNNVNENIQIPTEDLSSRSTKKKPCNSDNTSDSDSTEISQSSELSSGSGETFDMEGGILEIKPHLASQARRVLITQHRQLISKMVLFNKDDVNADLGAFGVTQYPPSLTPCPPRTLSGVSPIFLKEVEFTSDHIYKDRLIDLTVIDVPNFKLPMAHLTVEDLNGDVTLLFLKQERCKKSITEKIFFDIPSGVSDAEETKTLQVLSWPQIDDEGAAEANIFQHEENQNDDAFVSCLDSASQLQVLTPDASSQLPNIDAKLLTSREVALSVPQNKNEEVGEDKELSQIMATCPSEDPDNPFITDWDSDNSERLTPPTILLSVNRRKRKGKTEGSKCSRYPSPGNLRRRRGTPPDTPSQSRSVHSRRRSPRYGSNISPPRDNAIGWNELQFDNTKPFKRNYTSRSRGDYEPELNLESKKVRVSTGDTNTGVYVNRKPVQPVLAPSQGADIAFNETGPKCPGSIKIELEEGKIIEGSKTGGDKV
ncbi:unnamed protein product [Orchesella dallaii]|uniref:Uncharacterized protein n=1 Tax=Orchesella dallaii TaxID=48710 RepID=A0ABP1RS09_9HEXA